MSLTDLYHQFISGIKETTWLEYIAVFFGIGSVWYSRKENILVYPVGLVSTLIYIYISFKNSLIGEAGVNLYYTIMSVYGWILWGSRTLHDKPLVVITYSDKRESRVQIVFFTFCYLAIYTSLYYLKKNFAPGAIPWADAFASATAFTGMWLMARKKVESWYWWIATNLASIPLYFVKHLVFTSVLYVVLVIMAIFGLAEWKRRGKKESILYHG